MSVHTQHTMAQLYVTSPNFSDAEIARKAAFALKDTRACAPGYVPDPSVRDVLNENVLSVTDYERERWFTRIVNAIKMEALGLAGGLASIIRRSAPPAARGRLQERKDKSSNTRFLKPRRSSGRAGRQSVQRGFVGKRIRVRVEVEGRRRKQWFLAKIIKFNPSDWTHTVRYKNGDQDERLKLQDETYEAASDSGEAASDSGEAASDSEEAASDPDEAASDPDEAASDSDEAASDSDEAADGSYGMDSDSDEMDSDSDEMDSDSDEVVVRAKPARVPKPAKAKRRAQSQSANTLLHNAWVEIAGVPAYTGEYDPCAVRSIPAEWFARACGFTDEFYKSVRGSARRTSTLKNMLGKLLARLLTGHESTRGTSWNKRGANVIGILIRSLLPADLWDIFVKECGNLRSVDNFDPDWSDRVACTIAAKHIKGLDDAAPREWFVRTSSGYAASPEFDAILKGTSTTWPPNKEGFTQMLDRTIAMYGDDQ